MGMNFTLGMNAKFYFAAAVLTGQNESDILNATWTELTNVKDVTLNLETGEADVTTRANAGWRASAATLKNGTIEFQMQQKDTDAGLTKIQTAWLNSTEIALLCLDRGRTTIGCQGLASNFVVTNFSRSEPLEQAITYSVTVKPSSMQQWYVKGS
jgi:hypothetical protein